MSRLAVALMVLLVLGLVWLGCGKKEAPAPPSVSFAPEEEKGPTAPTVTEADTPQDDIALAQGVVVETIADQYGLLPDEVAQVQAEQGFSDEDLAIAFFLADAAPETGDKNASRPGAGATGRESALARLWGSDVAWAETNVIIAIVIRIGGWRSQGIGWGQVAHRLGVHPGTFNKDRVWLTKHAGRDMDDNFRLIVFAVVIQKWFRVPSAEVIVVFKAGQPHMDVFIAVYLGGRTKKPWPELLRAKPKRPDAWVTLFTSNNVQVKRPARWAAMPKPKAEVPGAVGKPEKGPAAGPPGKAGKGVGGAPKGKPGAAGAGAAKPTGPSKAKAGPAAKPAGAAAKNPAAAKAGTGPSKGAGAQKGGAASGGAKAKGASGKDENTGGAAKGAR